MREVLCRENSHLTLMKVRVRRGLFILLERRISTIRRESGFKIQRNGGSVRGGGVNRGSTPRHFGSHYGKKITRLKSMARCIGSPEGSMNKIEEKKEGRNVSVGSVEALEGAIR